MDHCQVGIEDGISLFEQMIILRKILKKAVKEGVELYTEHGDILHVPFIAGRADIIAVEGMDVDRYLDSFILIMMFQLTDSGNMVKMSMGTDNCEGPKVFNLDM